VRSDGPVVEPGWEIETLSLEDLVLAYMGNHTDAVAPVPTQAAS
jgi:hypothetical protein